MAQTITSKDRMQGHVALLLTNLVWGIMSPISKSLLLDGQMSALALSALRIGGAALLFAICSLFLPRSIEPHEHIERGDWWKIAVASLLMICSNQGLFIIGIGYTNPIDSTVMSSLTPMITMLLAAIVLRYPITRLKFAGVVIGLVGVVMLVAGNPTNELAINPWLGDALCFTAQACAAFYFVMFSGLINRYAPFTLMKWMFFISAVVYVPCCIPDLAAVPYAELPVDTWLSLAYIIVFATGLSYLSLPFAQRRLKPTVVCIYNYFQPVVAAVVTLLLGLGSFGPMKIAATVLIFLGIYFVNNNSLGAGAKDIN